jgi:hypothetical protein
MLQQLPFSSNYVARQKWSMQLTGGCNVPTGHEPGILFDIFLQRVVDNGTHVPAGGTWCSLNATLSLAFDLVLLAFGA